ncbi:hypothetical protein PN441_03685 [Spirulina major CS-329]|uniref:hypothetical protein n=1 Tax=Spirulina TaxID=1154 RepID=UPI0023313A27|nr:MULTISPECIES: hypothetical protein [Spirulina]MDB9495598.1 hypothetical protein [Spirulina subsalsa CS-330]MDB9502160.1 hypothetical protein [Spirulina major CS-329]
MERNTATLFEKLQSLPVEQLPAVEDFIDRLLAQSERQQVVMSMQQAAAPIFATTEDTPEDVVYDEMVLAQDWLKPEEDEAWRDL